jgi:hypothetical protein
VAGAPYSYTIGAGDELAIALANPGTYDLSLHGPNGFFRHFAGSPATVLQVEEHDHDAGKLRLRLTDGNRRRRPPTGRRRRRRRVRRRPSQIELNGAARSRSTPGGPAVGTTSH